MDNKSPFPQEKGIWMKSFVLIYTVLRLRMHGAIIPLPHTFSWLGD
jgi:hypothetical protein